ncbi:MAG TPA: hypothetical protein VI756_11070, partial [Blastocatellia bacterium]
RFKNPGDGLGLGDLYKSMIAFARVSHRNAEQRLPWARYRLYLKARQRAPDIGDIGQVSYSWRPGSRAGNHL